MEEGSHNPNNVAQKLRRIFSGKVDRKIVTPKASEFHKPLEFHEGSILNSHPQEGRSLDDYKERFNFTLEELEGKLF